MSVIRVGEYDPSSACYERAANLIFFVSHGECMLFRCVLCVIFARRRFAYVVGCQRSLAPPFVGRCFNHRDERKSRSGRRSQIF